MRVTYTTPSVVMYSPENITANGVHNQTHQMFSLSVVFRKKKKCESSVLAARGNGSYPITWVLYHQECICYLLGTDTGKALQIIPVNLNYIWHAVKSLDFKKLHRAPQRSAHCALNTVGLGFPWGRGVNTGKPSSWLHTGGLWAWQWPLCLLTFPFLSHKSYPGRVIWLSQTFSAIFGGWSCRMRW